MNPYQTISKMVEQVIRSIQNTGIAVMQRLHTEFEQLTEKLTAHTYPVEVKNPQTKVEVRGTVVVGNQGKMEKEVRDVSSVLREIKKILPDLNKVTVLNPTKIPDYPSEMKVTNFPDKTEVSNLPLLIKAIHDLDDTVSKIDVKPEVNVEAPNIPAPIVNIPKYVPPAINIQEKEVDLSPVKDLLDFWKTLSGSAKKSLSVRLTDGDKFYKAMEKMGEIMTANPMSAFQHYTGEGARGIVNRNNEVQVTVNDTWDVNDTIKASTTVTYFGEESVDGKWRVRKVTKAGSLTSIRHATIRNNPTYTNYIDAWNGMTQLVYGYAREAL